MKGTYYLFQTRSDSLSFRTTTATGTARVNGNRREQRSHLLGAGAIESSRPSTFHTFSSVYINCFQGYEVEFQDTTESPAVWGKVTEILIKACKMTSKNQPFITFSKYRFFSWGSGPQTSLRISRNGQKRDQLLRALATELRRRHRARDAGHAIDPGHFVGPLRTIETGSE